MISESPKAHLRQNAGRERDLAVGGSQMQLIPCEDAGDQEPEESERPSRSPVIIVPCSGMALARCLAEEVAETSDRLMAGLVPPSQGPFEHGGPDA
jgi:hypothetical protein